MSNEHLPWAMKPFGLQNPLSKNFANTNPTLIPGKLASNLRKKQIDILKRNNVVDKPRASRKQYELSATAQMGGKTPLRSHIPSQNKFVKKEKQAVSKIMKKQNYFV